MGIRKQRDYGPDNVSNYGATTATATADDMLVMATNNSSIVSKRSVERLYYPHEPHFFRFFVNKFQRRAPLINRGYHLRLHIIDRTLRNFLAQPSPRTKVVVNLGCGSDVIPWQCWTRYPQECTTSDAIFVDVDFPDLIRRKRHSVLNTPELLSKLSNVQSGDVDPLVLLRSDRYYQIGCDLRQTTSLAAAMASILDTRDCVFMFVAEVSITYMETNNADSVIQWASSLGQAEFCLLEQILPDGPDHPFASTMTSHFEKLSTPIKSVKTYPTIDQQRSRFTAKGWSAVQAQSLWSAWHDQTFFSPDDRRKLDLVEPFDEWEEFALFGSHYVLLHAQNYREARLQTIPPSPVSRVGSREVETNYSKPPGQHGLRRFGAAMMAPDAFGNKFILNCLGLGNTTRLPSYDIYGRQGSNCDIAMHSQGGPPSRMCFTMTDLGHHGILLAGGRSSPAKAMSDCWLYKKDTQAWVKASSLRVPLYRHSATRLSDSSMALVIGGRQGSIGLSDMIAVYHPRNGWMGCQIVGSVQPEPVFGATLTCCGRRPGSRPSFHGFLAGGLSSDGVVAQQILAWNLSFDNDNVPQISFDPLANLGSETESLLSRFGTACVQAGGSFVLVGGIGCDGMTRREDDIVVFSTSDAKIQATMRLAMPASRIPRPLLVGSSVVQTKDRELVIIGGAATCFSMGTFWTKGVYTLRLPDPELNSRNAGEFGWDFARSGEISQAPYNGMPKTSDRPGQAAKVRPIQRVYLNSKEPFEKVMAGGVPVILPGLKLGPCLTRWNLNYLADAIGPDRKVVVHDAQSKVMDFNAKNFRYTTMNFSDFAKGLQDGGRLYLRALSADAPADQAASLELDFPMLASDFTLPDELAACKDNFHSSILRMSGPVNMWLHYDVQANVYCQISGSKRMILFPPSDVTRLSFAPGASSSSIDVFGSLQSPALGLTHPMEVILGPGDVLYLPPLWLHTAEPTTDLSIAVNVFFRSLDRDHYAAGRDVYGNRDLAAYDRGRQEINRIVNGFGKVPEDCRQFYLLRLADELAQRADGSEP